MVCNAGNKLGVSEIELVDPAIIDKIYDAAFAPELWEEVCASICEVAQGYSASLIVVEGDKYLRWASGIKTLGALPVPQFSDKKQPDAHPPRDVKVTPREKLGAARSGVFSYALSPGHSSNEELPKKMPGSARAFLVVQRDPTALLKQTNDEAVNSLHPHLARAAKTSIKLASKQISAALDALECAGLPTAAVTADGYVLGVNCLMQALAPQVVIDAKQGVSFVCSKANSRFSETLKQNDASPRPVEQSFALPRTHMQPPAVVHIVPFKQNEMTISAYTAFFIIATPVDRSRIVSSATLQDLFDLSPAEARVARSVAKGNDVSAAAREFGLSVETVRSHIKSVLSKCRVKKQADFIASVVSVRPLRSDQ